MHAPNHARLEASSGFLTRNVCIFPSSLQAAAKKIKAKENQAKANPELAAKNKASADAKRERRAEAGSSKTFK